MSGFTRQRQQLEPRLRPRRTPRGAGTTYYALEQDTCTIAQTLTFPASGNYTLTFYAAGRQYASPSGSEGTIQAEVDGVNKGTAISPTSNAWGSFTDSLTGITAGTHTLLFQFSQGSHSDNTTFFTNVQMTYVMPSASLPVGTPLSIASGATVDLGGGSVSPSSLSNSGVSGGTVTNTSATPQSSAWPRQRVRPPSAARS